MKRTFTTLLLLAFYLGLHSQSITVSLPTVQGTVGQFINIPVKLSGAGSSGSPISSANIQITYDTAVLRYDTLMNFYTGMPQSQWYFSGHNGLVSANWLEPSLLTLTVPDNTTLYEIKFTYKGGSSPLNFQVNEFTDAAYNLIPTTTVNGAVNPVPVYRQVTFKVDMSKQNVSPYGVFLTGSFNNWSYTQNPMTLTTNHIYTTTVNILEGSLAQYLFDNGSSAAGLETVPANCGVPNGSGQYNRQIVVPNHDTVLNPVCFSMCGPCPTSHTVTLRVDMQLQNVSPEGVHAAGTFNGWNYSQTAMTTTGGSVYEISMILDEGTYMEFKYVNGTTVQQAETVPSACSVNGNRYFTVPAHDTVLTAYCFGDCIVCGGVAEYSQITFRVDMHKQTVSPDGVHIAGTFQGWDPASTPMETVGDSIYYHSDSLLAGTSVLYRFVNGNSVSGYEIVPSTCAVNDARALLIPHSDTLVKLVCFAECDTCNLHVGVSEAEKSEVALFQNYPNPSSSITNISCQVNRSGFLKIVVYSLIGQVVTVLHNGFTDAGKFSIPFNTAYLPSGIYYYQMSFTSADGSVVRSRKMIVQ
ncbi:MAG: cohesin domain-containing protein [Bacteroidota bacterium]